MHMIHWCDDKSHFYLLYSPAIIYPSWAEYNSTQEMQEGDDVRGTCLGLIGSQGPSVNTHAADCSSSRSSHIRYHRAPRHAHSARRRTHPQGSATQQRAAPRHCAVLLGHSTPGHTSLATPS